ncbi:MAG: tetratricopeptide repeat protein [Oscillochloris sp.]|nr:tetratricopeptide repeat protein [Oscillochloris sp.]
MIARARRLLSLVAERTGDYDAAIAFAQSGLDLARSAGLAARTQAHLYSQLAAGYFRRSEYTAAEAACRAGLRRLPEQPPSRERLTLLQRLATLDGRRGRYLQAVAILEQLVGQARELGDPELTAANLHNLGVYCYHLGRHEQARRCYEESLQLKEQIGDAAGRLRTLGDLGNLHLARGDTVAAHAAFTTAVTWSERLNMPEPLAVAAVNLGQLAYESADYPAAHTQFQRALKIYSELQDRDAQADCLYKLGDVALAQADVAAALNYGERSLALAEQIDSRIFSACARRVIGEALTLAGQLDAAAQALADARQLQDAIGDPFDTALILTAQARLAIARRDRVAAQQFIAAALTIAADQQVAYLIAALERLREQVVALPDPD